MSNNEDETISLLMDDELSQPEARRVLMRMRDDAALRASWQSYHLIRQGLRGDLGAVADEGFAARVSRELEKEPIVFAPKAKAAQRDWVRPVGGLALAAAISAIAVLGLREYGIGKLPYGGDAWLASVQSGEVQQAGNGLLSPEKLNEYLLMHSEGVYGAGAADMLPHARVVSIVNP